MAYFLHLFLRPKISQSPSNIDTELVENVSKNQTDLSFDEITYQANWIVVDEEKSITLHSNLLNKSISKQAKERNNCTCLVSGGFYDTSENHIGYFLESGKVINSPISSYNFNTYVSINSEFESIIDYEYPVNDILYSLQTGPMLFYKSNPLQLEIQNDKHARRIVAATDTRNSLIFIIIYDKATGISGPQLQNLPMLIEDFESKSGLNILNATNLDGGSASAFISDEISVIESQLIGSYFCIK